MLGSIIGDMVGSVYEGKKIRTKEFEIPNPSMRMTDDSLLTLAVAKSLMKHYPLKNEEGERAFQKDLAWEFVDAWKTHRSAGFGGMFFSWCSDALESGEIPPAYNSFGNGSAMRVSPVAYVAKDEGEAKYLAKLVSEITHNHEEGIKGAEAIALAVFMALHGQNKEAIKAKMLEYYPEIAALDFETLVRSYRFNATCQGSVPQAIYCFLISNGLEDTIRNCVAIGGDTDTLADMAGGIAEAYYQKGSLSDLEIIFLDRVIDAKTKDAIKRFYGFAGSKKLLGLN